MLKAVEGVLEPEELAELEPLALDDPALDDILATQREVAKTRALMGENRSAGCRAQQHLQLRVRAGAELDREGPNNLGLGLALALGASGMAAAAMALELLAHAPWTPMALALGAAVGGTALIVSRITIERLRSRSRDSYRLTDQ